MGTPDQATSEHLRNCDASDKLPEVGYIVYASLRDEANEGWAWLSLPDYPSRTLIEIRNGKQKVFCEYRKIDENFRRDYNCGRRTLQIDSQQKKCCALVLNDWYRRGLGIRTSWERACEADKDKSPPCNDETKYPTPLQIRPLKFWGWRSLRVTSHHPDIVVRLATRLGVLGALLGIVGILAGVFPLLENHRYSALAICGIAALPLAVAGLGACQGVNRD
jgi:hypothetical protein